MKRSLRWLVSAGALASVLVGCGGGDPVADRAPSSSPAPLAVPHGADESSATPFLLTTTTPIGPPVPASALPPATTESTTTTTAGPTTTTTTAPTTTAAPTTTTTAAPTTTTTAPTTTTTAPTTTTTTAPPNPSPPAATVTPSSPPPSSEWVVKAGESFWSVAATVTETRLGHTPTASEIVPLWRSLIEANRAQLPRPNNPNLIYVGTTLTVPP